MKAETHGDVGLEEMESKTCSSTRDARNTYDRVGVVGDQHHEVAWGQPEYGDEECGHLGLQPRCILTVSVLVGEWVEG